MYAHVNMDICTYAYISVVHSRQWKIEWYTGTTHLYIGNQTETSNLPIPSVPGDWMPSAMEGRVQ